MPNFQKNIQGDVTGKVGINRLPTNLEEQLHIDGVIQIGQDFAGGNAVKIRRNPANNKLQKDEGTGYVDLSSGNMGFTAGELGEPPLLEKAAIAGQYTAETVAAGTMETTALTTMILEG